MAHGFFRRAALTAASIAALAAAATAQAQTVQTRDCRYEPNFPIAAPYWIDQNGCLRMRRGGQDVFVTGSVAPPAGRVGTPVGTAPTGGVGLPPAGGVSPVVDGPRGPVGGNRPGTGNPPGANPPGQSPVADDGSDDGTQPGRGRDRSTRNDNGLGNGWDPGDVGFNDTNDLAKGEDPSNPAHGDGTAGPGQSGSAGGKGGNAGNGGNADSKGGNGNGGKK